MPTSDKDSRQDLIRELITQCQVSTQRELVKLLAEKGKKVTQATVSRDLKEMEVYLDRNSSGETIYVLPKIRPLSEEKLLVEHLERVLGEWTDKVSVSGNLVILKTPPGSAHVIASALDRSQQPNILATIAGDDTVFIAVATKEKPSQNAISVAREIEKLAGLTNQQSQPKLRN